VPEFFADPILQHAAPEGNGFGVAPGKLYNKADRKKRRVNRAVFFIPFIMGFSMYRFRISRAP